MPTVVIIHAAEDTLPARALAEKVRQAKLDVVLEKSGEELRTALKAANVTIALWSPRSASQPTMADDAAFARGKTKLIHASMQSATAPDQFRSDPAVNLTGWRGEDDFAAWRELAKLVTAKAGVPPLPPPAPRPPSGFFQPGVVAPQAQGASAPQQPARGAAQPPRQQQPQQRPQPQAAARPAPQPQRASSPEPDTGEKKGGANMMLIGIITFIVVAVAGGGGYWFMTQNSESAYASVDHDSVSALNEFLATDPPAADRQRARDDLARLEEAALADARAANSIDAWEGFLRDFPNSDEAVFAQGQIQQLRVQQATAPVGENTDTLPPAEPLDPDLVPPDTAPPATTPAPSTENGPQSLSPPNEPTTEPDDAPVP